MFRAIARGLLAGIIIATAGVGLVEPAQAATGAADAPIAATSVVHASASVARVGSASATKKKLVHQPGPELGKNAPKLSRHSVPRDPAVGLKQSEYVVPRSTKLKPSPDAIVQKNTKLTTNSAATATTFISGNVSSAAGPITDSLVFLYTQAGAVSGRDTTFTRTDNNGNYVLSGMAPGTYTIEFLQKDDGLADQWWKNTGFESQATFFTLAAGDQLTGANAVLPPAATITGTVTQADTKAAMSDFLVTAYASDGTIMGDDDGSAGSYFINNLPAGSYTLSFQFDSDEPYANVFWKNQALASKATYFSLTTGQQLTGMNDAVPRDVEISGTTQYATGGADSVEVDAIYKGTPLIEMGSSYSSYSDGSYTLTNLPAGSYTIRFVPLEANYRDIWWTNAYYSKSATFFTTTAGQLLTAHNASFTLLPGAVPAEDSGGGNIAENICGCVHQDPINTATGEYFENDTDIALPGVGPSVSVQRTYSSSGAATAGAFGYGWSSNIGTQLVVTSAPASGSSSPQAVKIVQANGAIVPFVLDSYGQYVPPARVFATLTFNSTSQQWTFTRRLKGVLTFNSVGELLTESDLNSNTVTYAYNSSNQVTSITGSGGRALTVTWTGSDVSKIADNAGRTVSYAYSAAGDLTSVTAVDGAKTAYAYPSGAPADHHHEAQRRRRDEYV